MSADVVQESRQMIQQICVHLRHLRITFAGSPVGGAPHLQSPISAPRSWMRLHDVESAVGLTQLTGLLI